MHLVGVEIATWLDRDTCRANEGSGENTKRQRSSRRRCSTSWSLVQQSLMRQSSAQHREQGWWREHKVSAYQVHYRKVCVSTMPWTDCTHNAYFELTLQKGVMESQKGTVKAQGVEGVELSLKLFPMAQRSKPHLRITNSTILWPRCPNNRCFKRPKQSLERDGA